MLHSTEMVVLITTLGLFFCYSVTGCEEDLDGEGFGEITDGIVEHIRKEALEGRDRPPPGLYIYKRPRTPKEVTE